MRNIPNRSFDLFYSVWHLDLMLLRRFPSKVEIVLEFSLDSNTKVVQVECNSTRRRGTITQLRFQLFERWYRGYFYLLDWLWKKNQCKINWYIALIFFCSYLVFQNSSKVSEKRNPVVIIIIKAWDRSPNRDWWSWLALTIWFSLICWETWLEVDGLSGSITWIWNKNKVPFAFWKLWWIAKFTWTQFLPKRLIWIDESFYLCENYGIVFSFEKRNSWK